jgi:DNA-binding NarL/FixJ family response regulator
MAGRALTLEQTIALALDHEAINSSPPSPRWHDALTPREREVADLVARGWKNREIAEQLFITEKTAKNHVAHILEKLGVASRTRLAALMTEHWNIGDE